MSRHFYDIIYSNEDLALNQTSDHILLHEYDSYHVFGSTDTSHGSLTVQCSIDASNFYDTTNSLVWNISGDVFGSFMNDAKYIRMKAGQDTSNVTLLLSARKGD